VDSILVLRVVESTLDLMKVVSFSGIPGKEKAEVWTARNSRKR
jgi:hypothetical protein